MAKERLDPKLRKEIKVGLQSKIILLIVVLIGIIMGFVYRTILRDEQTALVNQMVSGGGAVASTLAINSFNLLLPSLLKIDPSGRFNERTYQRLDDEIFFNFEDSVNQLVQQKDIVYAVVVNKFGQIIAHSKGEEKFNPLSDFQPLAGIRMYKDLYAEGQAVSFITQNYTGPFFNPKTGQPDEGELLDISFPLIQSTKKASIKNAEGEIHIGLSKDTIGHIVRDAKAKLQGVATVSFLIGLLGAILLASIIISPIQRLVLAMGKVARGDMKQKVIVRTGDEIQLLASSFNKMTDGMSKYVSAGLVKKLMEHPDSLTLGGSYKKITIMESDIRSFTSISEKMRPDEVVSMLNEYLDIMSKVVIKHGGEIDKYIGDAILAHFGMFDPNDDKLAENAKTALRVVVEMNQELIPYNERRKAAGLVQVRFGVGIHTADIIVGNIGSTERMDYTVIGDGMNLTARLCDNAGKDYKEDNGNIVHLRNILMTEATYELVKDIAIVDDKILHIKVKGKEKPIKIYQAYDIRG